MGCTMAAGCAGGLTSFAAPMARIRMVSASRLRARISIMSRHHLPEGTVLHVVLVVHRKDYLSTFARRGALWLRLVLHRKRRLMRASLDDPNPAGLPAHNRDHDLDLPRPASRHHGGNRPLADRALEDRNELRSSRAR